MSSNSGLYGMPGDTPYTKALRAPSKIEDGKRIERPLSPWSASIGKRLFDLICVIIALPIALPILLLTAIAVRITSAGPVLFRQHRMGRHGEIFTIIKFRTMPVRRHTADRPAVTTAINQRFTPVGAFLRRWKLDELPQILNVLRGDMSLVGPRPKVPKHQSCHLASRPGITGGATVIFAREEVILSNVPSGHLDTYYHAVILPFKQMLDDDYMAKATFSSDIRIILKSLFRKWDDLDLSDLIPVQTSLVRPSVQTRISIDNTNNVPLAGTLHAQAVTLSGQLQAD